jgi:hypothetical protein
MIRTLRILSGIIYLIVSLGALPSGLLFILYPDGSAMNISVSALANSPFRDYLIPGLFLFTVNGIANFIESVLCFGNRRYYKMFGLVLGILLVIWIAVQVSVIGFTSFLQPVFFSVGLIEMILIIILMRMEKTQSAKIISKS